MPEVKERLQERALRVEDFENFGGARTVQANLWCQPLVGKLSSRRTPETSILYGGLYAW